MRSEISSETLAQTWSHSKFNCIFLFWHDVNIQSSKTTCLPQQSDIGYFFLTELYFDTDSLQFKIILLSGLKI